jgi:O-antigen ligase
MPPILAVLLCCPFVLTLLRYDRKISGALSVAVWLPTFWMMRCASVPFDTWFDLQVYRELGASVEAGNPFDRNVLIVLIAAGVLVLMKRGFNAGAAVKDNKWLFVLLAYMFVSILWSDYTLVSLKRWFKVSGTLVMALVVLTEMSPVHAIESILRRTVYVAIPFSLVLVKYYPELGVNFGRYSGDVSWAGVAEGKNGLGLLCIIAIMIWVKDWIKKREPAERVALVDKAALFGLLAVALWLLRGPGGAYSATSLINLTLAIPLFFLLRRFNSPSQVVMFCAVGASIAVFVPIMTQVIFGATPVEIVAPLVGRDPSLTGRADAIWEPLTTLALQHPIVGLGYGGFWVFPIVLDKFSINQAHNGYLDIFIELGAIGLLLFSLVIVEFFVKAIRVFRYDPHWGAFIVTFLIMSLVHNYTESSYLKSTALIWAIFCMLAIAGSARQRLAVATESIVRGPRPQLKAIPSPLVRGPRSWSRPATTPRNRQTARQSHRVQAVRTQSSSDQLED